MLTPEKKVALFDGLVIPAHPLALHENRQLDVSRQRALTRYYMASGAGGIAVGVHTTQFEIRDVGLLEPVLRLAAQTVQEVLAARGRDGENAQVREGSPSTFLMLAGVAGPIEQAVREANIARDLGYDLALVSPGGLGDYDEAYLLKRIQAVADVLPVFGFYLQPAVGGRYLSYEFWRQAAEIPGVMAIKMAPFDRYQTLDVVRAVCSSTRRDEITLYTGNDDHIIADLLSPYRFAIDGQVVEKQMVGGLLGHFSVWTKRVVDIFDEVRRARKSGLVPQELLTLANEITDANAAFFDPQHYFKGSIAGIHEVLRRQGLLEGIWCINPEETLSPGQLEEIDRVYRMYPHLNDDDFVKAHLSEWC